jgi:hypothetical protein
LKELFSGIGIYLAVELLEAIEHKKRGLLQDLFSM